MLNLSTPTTINLWHHALIQAVVDGCHEDLDRLLKPGHSGLMQAWWRWWHRKILGQALVVAAVLNDVASIDRLLRVANPNFLQNLEICPDLYALVPPGLLPKTSLSQHHDLWSGWSTNALGWALHQRHHEAVHRLIPVSDSTLGDVSLLSSAVGMDEAGLVDDLLKHVPRRKLTIAHQTVYRAAARFGRLDILDHVLPHVGDLNSINRRRETAIMLAVNGRHTACVQRLAPLVDLSIEDALQRTALMLAVDQNDDALVAALVDRTPLTLHPIFGISNAFLMAAQRESLPILERLWQAGHCPLTKPDSHRSVLVHALQGSATSVVVLERLLAWFEDRMTLDDHDHVFEAAHHATAFPGSNERRWERLDALAIRHPDPTQVQPLFDEVGATTMPRWHAQQERAVLHEVVKDDPIVLSPVRARL